MPNETSGSSGIGGSRYNDGKIRWSLMSVHALRELIKVLEFGAKKYASWNWSNGLSWTDTYDSLQRHATAWLGGEDKDPETGLSHMAHVLCNAMFLVHFVVTGTGRDDRPAAQKNNNNAEEKIDVPRTFEQFIERVQDAAKRADEQRAYRAIDPIRTVGYPYPLTTTYIGGCGTQDAVVAGGVSDVQANVCAPSGNNWHVDPERFY